MRKLAVVRYLHFGVSELLNFRFEALLCRRYTLQFQLGLSVLLIHCLKVALQRGELRAQLTELHTARRSLLLRNGLRTSRLFGRCRSGINLCVGRLQHFLAVLVENFDLPVHTRMHACTCKQAHINGGRRKCQRTERPNSASATLLISSSGRLKQRTQTDNDIPSLNSFGGRRRRVVVGGDPLTSLMTDLLLRLTKVALNNALAALQLLHPTVDALHCTFLLMPQS